MGAENECSDTLEWARYYRSKGWSVIPLRPQDKRPCGKWEEYQRRRACDEELTEWFQGGKRNIGIVTGNVSGLAVVDIDTGDGWKGLEPMLSSHLETPVVHTPRGGRHLYYSMPEGQQFSNNAGRVPGADFRGEGGYVAAPPSLGANGNPYVWKKKPDCPLLALPLQYINIILLGGGGRNSTSTVYVRGVSSGVVNVGKCRQEMFRNGTRDDDLFHTAHHLLLGKMPADEVRQVLKAITFSWGESQPECRTDAWINDKVESAEKRLGRAAGSLAADVREWVLSSSGVFMSSEVGNCLQVSSRDEKKNLSKALGRLAEEGVIQKVGSRNGQFRRVEEVVEQIEWSQASTETPWQLAYPFGLERYYLTLPKNIIVVDGATDSGKTAFLLNVAYKNAYRYPHRIHYFSSEMGALELRSRIDHFDEPHVFKDVHFWERSQNFADVIRPDDVNIVDYLELSDEFWKVGGMIREIHDRLRDGICIIARQKLKGAKSGRGGDFGKEKARLVLLMDPGEFTIDKCKNWADPSVNPNNKTWKFKLVKGCKFLAAESNAISEVDL